MTITNCIVIPHDSSTCTKSTAIHSYHDQVLSAISSWSTVLASTEYANEFFQRIHTFIHIQQNLVDAKMAGQIYWFTTPQLLRGGARLVLIEIQRNEVHLRLISCTQYNYLAI